MLIKDKNKTEIYINLLILASILGGLGKRVRKGCGSFTITNIDVISDKKITNKYNDILKKSIFDILELVCKDIIIDNKVYPSILNFTDKLIDKEVYQTTYFKVTEDISENYPYIQKLFIKELKSNFDEAINVISNETHKRLAGNYLTEYKRYNRAILGTGQNRFASPVYITFWEEHKKEQDNESKENEGNNSKKYLIVKVLNYKYKKDLDYKYEKNPNYKLTQNKKNANNKEKEPYYIDNEKYKNKFIKSIVMEVGRQN